MIILYLFLFIFCCGILYFSGELVIKSLIRIARFLNWKEFVVAFFTIAFAASLPNLFVGIASALHKIPQLSFGDIVGGNVVDLSLAIGLAVLFSNNGIIAKSRTIQASAIYTFIAAILPLILFLDGTLSRSDGIILIGFFFFYFFWIFSKRERFSKVLNNNSYNKPFFSFEKFRKFLRDLASIIGGICLLLLVSELIVRSAQFFAQSFELPIDFIGILIVGLGNALPETYFSILSARKGEGWMILGNLMGAVIVPATLVLGIVALIQPIVVTDFSPFAIGRFFLIISSLFFFFFVKTDQKITKKEGVFLLFIYFVFLITEIFVKI